MGNPTRKPRINLVLEPELFGMIRELAELQGRSMASIVMELLEAAAPALTELRDTLHRVSSLNDEGKAAVLKAAQEAAHALEPAAEEAERQWSFLDEAIRAAAHPSKGSESA